MVKLYQALVLMGKKNYIVPNTKELKNKNKNTTVWKLFKNFEHYWPSFYLYYSYSLFTSWIIIRLHHVKKSSWNLKKTQRKNSSGNSWVNQNNKSNRPTFSFITFSIIISWSSERVLRSFSLIWPCAASILIIS